MKTFNEFKSEGRKLYRGFLKEDLVRMKVLAEGMRMFPDESLLEEYRNLAANCLKWKRLLQLNK